MTSLVILIVLVRVIVPLHVILIQPPCWMAARKAASLDTLTTLDERDTLVSTNAATELVTLP